ncbi:MAG: hypothetical protein HZB53_11545 [Chloroflexi bacterium]|nr:hypothetical protein [Chloroflexota bacterium]
MPSPEPNSARSAPEIVVDKLTTVVRNKAGDPIFIGWGPDGNAAATKDRREVSPAGQDILRVYERARNLLVPVVPYLDLEPVEFSYLKLRDLAEAAEDHFLVNTRDSRGGAAQFRIGEVALLESIVNARGFFQDTSTGGAMGQKIVPSEAIYAVVAPCFELDDKRQALILLFKPLVDGAPQEASFHYFVVSVLRFLWQNDRKDPPAGRKGYYAAVQPYLGDPKRPVPFLLRMVFKEEAAREKWERLKRLMYKQSEPGSSEDADTLGDLAIDQLFALATAMRDAARAYFERLASARRSFRFDKR